MAFKSNSSVLRKFQTKDCKWINCNRGRIENDTAETRGKNAAIQTEFIYGLAGSGAGLSSFVEVFSNQDFFIEHHEKPFKKTATTRSAVCGRPAAIVMFRGG
jgi:hypothetical protein